MQNKCSLYYKLFFAFLHVLNGCTGITIEMIKGYIAILTPKEAKELQLFSIIKPEVCSTRLLLGPLRFVNHSCDPNAKVRCSL